MMYASLPKAIVTLCFLSSFFILNAQNKTFFLQPKWTKGETHRFELTKGKHVIKNNQQSTENESRQIVTVSVVEATTKGYLVAAVYENTFGSNESVEVRYTIGQNGDFQGIVNMRDVQKTFYSIFDNLTAIAASNPSVAKSVGEMRQLMTSDNYVTYNYFQELTLIHQFYNNTFTVDSLERYETQLPNLFDPKGKPFNAQATLLAKCDNSVAYIRHTVEPDMQGIKQQAAHFMNRMSGSNSSKWSVDIQPTSPLSRRVYDSMEAQNEYIFDENFCAFNLKTGWLTAFQRKRTILENDVKTVEFVFLKEIK
ncbi:MAG: hypothetical protein JNL70_04405 [Saprospiraceae bacterium]|nr:hypothetical protein [Saprospiraceae bacterium]